MTRMDMHETLHHLRGLPSITEEQLDSFMREGGHSNDPVLHLGEFEAVLRKYHTFDIEGHGNDHSAQSGVMDMLQTSIAAFATNI